MNANDVLKYIQEGENLTVEFKSWIKGKSFKEIIGYITKELVGFANAKGGQVLLGVEDNGTITGCNNYDKQDIIERIYDKTRPSMYTEIEEIIIQDKTILVISVEQGTTTYATSSGEVYKRLGKNTKPYFPE